MNTMTKNRRACGALVTATCLMLTGYLAGCSPESTSAPETAPGSAETAPADTPVLAATQPQLAPASSDEQRPGETTLGKTTQADAPEVEIGSCDGTGVVQVSEDLTGQPLADTLMDEWKRNHPEADWVTEEKEKHAFQPPADNSDLLIGGQGKGHTYGNYTERDILTWAREAEKFVAEGSRIFHSADELGSEVAVSCDMCHPHAANTHPETYPKFQPQLGRVALLRDMIDWCVENPVRGDHMDADSPKMRALEAYIMAQRKGVEMDYGKH
jgi:hypothetical protein